MGLVGRLHRCEWRIKGIKAVVCVLRAPVGVPWARGTRLGEAQISQTLRVQKFIVQLGGKGTRLGRARLGRPGVRRPRMALAWARVQACGISGFARCRHGRRGAVSAGLQHGLV